MNRETKARHVANMKTLLDSLPDACNPEQMRTFFFAQAIRDLYAAVVPDEDRQPPPRMHMGEVVIGGPKPFDIEKELKAANERSAISLKSEGKQPMVFRRTAPPKPQWDDAEPTDLVARCVLAYREAREECADPEEGTAVINCCAKSGIRAVLSIVAAELLGPVTEEESWKAFHAHSEAKEPARVAQAVDHVLSLRRAKLGGG